MRDALHVERIVLQRPELLRIAGVRQRRLREAHDVGDDGGLLDGLDGVEEVDQVAADERAEAGGEGVQGRGVVEPAGEP